LILELPETTINPNQRPFTLTDNTPSRAVVIDRRVARTLYKTGTLAEQS
jgi:hypothetical protein